MLVGENKFKKLNERKITMSAGGFSLSLTTLRGRFPVLVNFNFLFSSSSSLFNPITLSVINKSSLLQRQ